MLVSLKDIKEGDAITRKFCTANDLRRHFKKKSKKGGERALADELPHQKDDAVETHQRSISQSEKQPTNPFPGPYAKMIIEAEKHAVQISPASASSESEDHQSSLSPKSSTSHPIPPLPSSSSIQRTWTDDCQSSSSANPVVPTFRTVLNRNVASPDRPQSPTPVIPSFKWNSKDVKQRFEEDNQSGPTFEPICVVPSDETVLQYSIFP